MKRNYTRHEKRLLRVFDWQAGKARSVLTETFGAPRAAAIETKERDEYTDLIRRLDYIGPIWNYFVQEAIVGVMAVALYRALRAEGLADDESGRVMYRAYEAVAAAVPDRAAAMQKRLTHSRPVALYMRVQAALSRRRKHPDFFVFDYVGPDKTSHDWGLDFHECAIKKFCDKVGEPQCLPLICTIDYPLGQRFGWGLRRDQTISAGDPACTFRFKRGRETPTVSTWETARVK